MSLVRTLFILVWGALMVTFVNRGGGPFVSHAMLTFVTLLAVLLVALRGLVRGWKKTTFSPRFLWVHALYGLFCVITALSIIFGLTPEYGLSELLLYIDTGVLMFLFSGLPLDESDVKFFITGVLGITVVAVFVGLYFYITSPVARLAGTFLYPSQPQNAAFNSFANVLVIIFVPALWYATQHFKNKWQSAVVVSAAGVIGAGLLLTFSRAAYLSLIGIGLVFAILTVIVHRKKVVGRAQFLGVRMLSVLLVVVSLFTAAQILRGLVYDTVSLKDKLLFASDEGASSAVERLDYWKAAVQIIGERPLLGSGILSFRFLYPQYQYRFGIVEDHPHNLFLKIGVESGVFAMLLYIVFLFAAAVYALRFGLRSFSHPAFYLMIGAGAAFVHNLIDFNFIASNYLLCTVSIGLLLGSARSLQKSKLAPRDTQVLLLATLIISLGTTVVAAHEAYYNIDLQRARGLVEAGNLSAAAPHLERAKKLIFKRDFYSLYSDYNRAQFKATGEEKWLIEEQSWIERGALPRGIEHPSLNADYYARYGESRWQLTSARKSGLTDNTGIGLFLADAVRLDPQNNIRYYYYLAKFLRATMPGATPLDISSRIEESGGRNISVLLNEYADVLAHNEHFTILTENPEYAIKLASLLHMTEISKTLSAEWVHQNAVYKQKFVPR